MTTTCTRDYILTVNHGLTVDAYWTFDNFDIEAGPTLVQIDQTAGIKLFSTGAWFGWPTPPPLNNTPGKIGNGLGFQQEGVAAGTDSGSVASLRLSSTNGWSVFFWFNVNNWAPSYSVYPLVDWKFGLPSEMRIQFGDFPAVHQLLFNITDSTGADYSPAPFSPTLNTWYFMHVFYDPVSAKVGYQINNGAKVLSASSNPVFNVSANGDLEFFQNWPGSDTSNYGPIIDEFGMKLSRVLTPTEVSFLYNSGSGRTWPL